ncbi:hypothetical protein ACFCWG_33075 [Streptomyces sp. NPDC056390]|uniref:hypothetical protein n=1 Tax=Streptomyces sp. NPDC056390 TaxID=3345806 RepID=UPI0035E32C35
MAATDVADEAAAAADADPQWTRLADSINTIAMIFQGAADQGDTTGATITDDDDTAIRNANRTVHAECRKAFATG